MNTVTRCLRALSVARGAAVACAMLASAVANAGDAVQWPLADGGNGHWYQLAISGPITWTAAKAACEEIGGHLVTPTSSAENAFVTQIGNRAEHPTAWVNDSFGNAGGPWLGGYQPLNAPIVQPWSWVSGEPWAWTGWALGEPNGGYGPEVSVTCMLGFSGSNDYRGWADAGLTDFPPYPLSPSYIIEWSADCNNDGIVDYGQILSGTLADANANGVPDTCESTLLVPSQYPTIQAAIDAVPAGAHRTVEVAAGTYHESFALNGKDVIVRGAANNATILDGTGLTTSIARFTGGEPATAGVESLVFRNGIVGSRFTPKSTFTIGGALYGVNSAAAIRNCRFEQNIADFGGGVYLLRCAMSVVDSDFAGNTARDEGGGMQVYETTGVVSGCDFTQNLSGTAGPGSGSGFKAVGAHAAGETVLLTGCTFDGGISGVNGSAVEYYENTANVPGILRMSGCAITGNSSGLGAGGLRVIGGMYSCVLTGGTAICSNTTSNVDGPYLIEGSATVCDCLADLTHDGAVNGGDLGVLLSNWGLTLPSGAGDVNHDGVVNAADLGVLLNSWGECTHWYTVLTSLPDPTVVTDASLRSAIIATGYPWRVRDTATQIEMLLVPQGTFDMGCTASNSYGCYPEESPTHSVTITDAFYMGRYEVTQAQWQAKMGSNPSFFQGASYPDAASRPVEKVSWNTIQGFLTATGMQLPTEAQWEYACRAGTTTAFHGFTGYLSGTNDDTLVGNIAWYANAGSQTHAVGGKAANGLGLHDMSGNVWEWCNDWSGAYSATAQTNPTGPTTGTNRVLRGGSSCCGTDLVRSSIRGSLTPVTTGPYWGFRVRRAPF